MMDGKSDWASSTLMEAPFWRDGMSPEEYEIEREYYAKNFNLVKKHEYQPLWVQALQTNLKRTDMNNTIKVASA